MILINKPEGLRSTTCLNMLKRKFHKTKIGHSGTLDSTASGLLVVLLGNATRLSDYVMSLEKIYRVEIQFGAETDTCDYSGNITRTCDCSSLNQTQIQDAIYKFLGHRLQRPPEISAVKINGKSAYKLARSGHEIRISERPVFLKNIRVISELENNIAKFEITCSKGTYIRSFARDFARFMNCAGFVKSLERIAIGNLTLEQAQAPDSDLRVMPLESILENFQRVKINPELERKFFNGLAIPIENAAVIKSRVTSSLSNLVCVDNENFAGFGEIIFPKNILKPVTIIPFT